MNKVTSVTLISVFILSTLIGYLPVTTTQATTTSLETYIVPVQPPYIFAVVITGVNMGNPTSTGLIGYLLNRTSNATELSIYIYSVNIGKTFASFTGNVTQSMYFAGQYDAYYSPAAQAIVMVFGLNETSPTSYPLSSVVRDVFQATGVNLVNSTFPYLIDAMGNKVYTNESITLITANAIVNSSGISLSDWSYYKDLISPAYLQQNNDIVFLTVKPTKVYTPSAPTGVPAPSATATLFTPSATITPVATSPAYIFYLLTVKYVNATYGYPVGLAQSVVAQPFVSLNDTFLAKALAGVVAHLYVTNVTIIDHYGNRYMIYYNSTNGSTEVVINGKVVYTYIGNLLPTIPETAPNTGIFNGTPITFVINMPGTIYRNGTVFNGTLAVELGNNIVTLGPATNFVLPYFSFNENLFGFGSTMYVTVQDPISGSTLTVRTYIDPYYLAPIRMAPVNIQVPMPANASDEFEYEDNQSIVLSPTSQYIVIHVTSIVNYTYVFYIASIVQLGKDNPEGPTVSLSFQTIVPIPVIGPGIVAEVPVLPAQIGALGTGYYTITMFAVPFAGGPVISLYPAKLVYTSVYVNATSG